MGTAMTNAPAALVTGAAIRIGRAIAIDLARHGWAVAVHYNGSAAAAKETVATIVAGGGLAVAVQADLGNAGAVAGLVPAASAAVGPLTLLVNNASVFEYDTVESATVAGWDSQIDINLRAPFFLSQAFAAQLPPGAREGNIVNLIDQRVWKLSPFFASYTVSKAGLWTITQTMAMALAPRIRVNAIGPGPTLPNVHQRPGQFEQQVAATPLGRGASLDDVTTTVRHILATRSLTGQMIALDGGQHLPWSPVPNAAALDK
jgi:NAD(P)-dependent dehydrogenase (short-subunit alcohol dehydrogenase family)